MIGIEEHGQNEHGHAEEQIALEPESKIAAG